MCKLPRETTYLKKSNASKSHGYFPEARRIDGNPILALSLAEKIKKKVDIFFSFCLFIQWFVKYDLFRISYEVWILLGESECVFFFFDLLFSFEFFNKSFTR